MEKENLLQISFLLFCLVNASLGEKEKENEVADLLRQLESLSDGSKISVGKDNLQKKSFDIAERKLLNALNVAEETSKRDHLIPELDLSRLKCSDMYLKMREKVDSLSKKYCRPDCQGYMQTCADNSDCCDGFRCFVWQCKPWHK